MHRPPTSIHSIRGVTTERTNSVKGFTLIEILVVIGMLAILTTVVLVAVNPLRQFAQARNSQRQANVATVLNAVGNHIADNGGIFENVNSNCQDALPATPAYMTNETDAGPRYDIRGCLVPDYLPELPHDPRFGRNLCRDEGCRNDGQSYNTRYTIAQNPVTKRITVCAPDAVETVLGTDAREICLTR